jgi:anhydro-N-acetylmuramic acid kinase
MGDRKMNAIGLMSGTSLDGLDICSCSFAQTAGNWNFRINCAKTYPYPDHMMRLLGKEAQYMTASEFVTFHSAYGKYLGERVNEFMDEFNVTPDIIASHGHTIFHEPRKNTMFQIGDGAAIAAETGIPTVSDFRRLDILLGGQGAPLVPVGDRLLFSGYTYCLNLGGFSNISFEEEGKRVAFDVCPVNYVMNHYSRLAGQAYDPDGELARAGRLSSALYDQLNALDYYRQERPKSLGREWVEQNIFPLMDGYPISLEDKLHTFCEHAAFQIARITKAGNNLLATGGGTFNKYLIERIRRLCPCGIVIPDKQIIEYKEALIFAFLGVLYMFNEPNCLASVTGAAAWVPELTKCQFPTCFRKLKIVRKAMEKAKKEVFSTSHSVLSPVNRRTPGGNKA